MPPRDRTRTTVDWAAVNASVQRTRVAVERLADWELELLGTTREDYERVNGTLSEQGEEEVPPRITTNVLVDPGPGIRTTAFDSSGIARRLAATTEEADWLSALEEFRQATRPFDHPIFRGSYDVGLPTVNLVGYGGVRVDELPVEVADQMVRAASDDRVFLSQVDPDSDSRWRLTMSSALEDEAWQEYYGRQSMKGRGDYDYSNSPPTVGASKLRVHMNAYADWRTTQRRTYMSNRMKARMIAGLTGATPEQQARTILRTQKFSSFISNVKAGLKVAPHPFRLMETLPHGTLSSRRWGIEVESPYIDGVETPKGWLLKPDGSLRGLQVSNHAPYLEHGDSCAFFSETQTCDCGLGAEGQAAREFSESEYPVMHNETTVGEWNSPVLRSYHSRGLKYLTDKLEHRKVNDTASCHVHVEAADLTAEQVVRLALIFSALEPLWVAEYFRADRQYCKALDSDMLITRFNKAKEAGKNVKALTHQGKYYAVNFNSLGQHGTVEFRTMGPRYNYAHLTRWASFCREMVNIAKADVPQKDWAKVRTFEDLLTLFSKYGKETPTPPWAKNAIVKDVVAGLGTERRRFPNAIEQADGVEDVHDDYYIKEPITAMASPRW